MTSEKVPSGSVTSPMGFAAGAVACGLKESGNLDLALLYSSRDCTAAGVFTMNQVVAAPVILDKEVLAADRNHLRGVVVNAGNANACTGRPGLEDAREMQRVAAGLVSSRPEQILVLSTGVIGVPLPMEKVTSGLRTLSGDLSPDNGPAAAQAIMTTDTWPKQLALDITLPGGRVTLGGMAKGSGMIHPNMATLLAVITTDAAIPAEPLQEILGEATDLSFNRISIDGDTSTNDSVLLLANGASGVVVDDEAALSLFAAGLDQLCIELAKMIVRDGEGVTKFVNIEVTGLATEEEARAITETIATSPLVKTALAGSDPNWGRILAAAGRAGVPFDQDQVRLWISGTAGPTLQLIAEGIPTDYAESDAAAIFAQTEINIRLDLGQGEAEYAMWTGDLTKQYVTINADYRT